MKIFSWKKKAMYHKLPYKVGQNYNVVHQSMWSNRSRSGKCTNIGYTTPMRWFSVCTKPSSGRSVTGLYHRNAWVKPVCTVDREHGG